jgi:transcriptional regulator with XRE-family HTH domain
MDEHFHGEAYRVFLRLLRNTRESAGITQKQLASRLNETQSFVSKCERGERRLDVIELFMFCAVMDVDALVLVAAISTAIRGGAQ